MHLEENTICLFFRLIELSSFMSENSLLNRLDGIESRYEEVSTLITDPEVIADIKRYVRLNKEYKELGKLVEATRRYRALINDIEDARNILAVENDSDLREIAQETLTDAQASLPELETEIKLLLIPAEELEVTRPLFLPVISRKCTSSIVRIKDGKLPSHLRAKELPVVTRRL